MHADHITWEQFEANPKHLAGNALGFGGARKAGPTRKRPALLQGRVVCSLCGEENARMQVQSVDSRVVRDRERIVCNAE
jgi:hypothetical protein